LLDGWIVRSKKQEERCKKQEIRRKMGDGKCDGRYFFILFKLA
jgi:hypothetical protein